MPAAHEYDRPKIMALICDLLAEGQTLRKICTVEGMPKPSTVCSWLLESTEYAEQYARARQLQADYFADETIDIADSEPDPQVARVRIDARKWHASKTAPKKYGDKVMQEHTGEGGGPIKTEAEVVLRPQVTREEWLALHGMDTPTRTATSGD